MLKDATCKCLPKRKGSWSFCGWISRLRYMNATEGLLSAKQQNSNPVTSCWNEAEWNRRFLTFHFLVACPTARLFFQLRITTCFTPSSWNRRICTPICCLAFTFIVKWNYFLRLTEGWLEELGGFSTQICKLSKILKQQQKHAQG